MSVAISWKDERARLVRSAPNHVGRGTWARETREVFACREETHRKHVQVIHERPGKSQSGSYAKKTSIKPYNPVEKQFDKLVDEWRKGIGGISSATRIILHPAYQAIIGLGPDAVPLILREMTQRPSHWSWALRALTKEDPVPPGAAGNLRAISSAWLEWGRQHQMLS